MELYFITGASRGLGHAIADALRDSNHALFLVSRSGCVVEHGCMQQVSADLADPVQIDQALHELKAFADELPIESVTLINNAGTVEPIRAAVDCTHEEISHGIQLNLVAPMLLSTAVLRLFTNIPVRVVNISSGAAHSPYHGWSVYCTSKAGLDHFNRCLGLELGNNNRSAMTLSIAPGVIDTQMQDVIRSSDVADFPSIEKFMQLKADGALLSPEQAAQKLLQFLNAGEYENGGVYDLRHL